MDFEADEWVMAGWPFSSSSESWREIGSLQLNPLMAAYPDGGDLKVAGGLKCFLGRCASLRSKGEGIRGGILKSSNSLLESESTRSI